MRNGSTYKPPTDEQLARFAVVTVKGAAHQPSDVDLALRMFKLTPSIRDRWLENHRQLQEQIVTNAYRSATGGKDDA